MPRGSSDSSLQRVLGRRTVACLPHVLVSLALLLLAAVFAQGSLYGPDAPRDAAYLRIVNAMTGTSDELTAVVDGSEREPLAFGKVSPYEIVEPGTHTVELAGTNLEFTAEPESFTTVVALPDSGVAIEDTALRDISRGLLTLYNLTADAQLTLLTTDGNEVLSDVPPLSQASVAISEAEVTLSIVSGNEEWATLPARLYSRGDAHSIIVLPQGSDPMVVYVKAGAQR